MTEITFKDQMECLKEQFELAKEEEKTIEFRPQDAVVLYPALGNPAIIKKDGDDATLELLVLCKAEKLQRGEVAFHLRLSHWNEKDNGNVCDKDEIWKNYLKDKEGVEVTDCYEINENTFGEGANSPDADDKFNLKLGHINVFPWVLEGLSKYGYLYKVKIKLKNKATGMYNIWWVNEQDYHEVKNKPKWWNLVQHIKDLNAGAFKMPRPFKKELKEYSGDVVQSDKKEENENIRASIYHPVYITTKPQLNIGHITDVHLDSRMDVYGQSEASVIEVEENCKPEADGNVRKIKNKDFHAPIKDKIANFNKIFTEICHKLKSEGADTIVVTGDLVDYNKGIHTPQTHRTCFTPISEVWDQLGASVTKDDSYRDDRNWFLFYKKLMELYDRGHEAIPVFTMLGNHDYVNYGMAPWPLWGIPWNGVFDQNLTLYESALCFGPGYDSSKAFLKDIAEKAEFVEWYTIFINPFADFVVEYEDQSLYMVDWGVKSNVIDHGLKTKLEGVIPGYDGAGGLHHARHLFKGKSDFTIKNRHTGETEKSPQPFPMKNYSIYKSWLKSEKTKILFMHATAICPRDDVSVGQINHDLEWTDNKLAYGSFDSRRNEIIKDVENGKLDIIISGHSHRNLVMQVSSQHSKKAKVLGSGETYGTITHQSKNLIMVTSSGGPLPKYIPGGQKICACHEQYNHGWDFEGNKFYKYQYDERTEITDPEKHKCTKCGMPAKKMKDKKPKRHSPGGSLLSFYKEESTGNDMVLIESVPAAVIPRFGVMSDEHEVFTKSMKLEKIDSFKKYIKWDDEAPITIISRQSFKRYGYMDFPEIVQYVTYEKEDKKGNIKGLRGKDNYKVKDLNFDNNEAKIKQEIGKDEFKFLMKAAKSNYNFAFTRYLFFKSPLEKWDREIKMHKNHSSLSEQPSRQEIEKTLDEFDGLVISFKRKPDLKKRIKICEY